MNTITYVQFAIATLLPVVAAGILDKLRRNQLASVSEKPWQILCGVVFGIIAILGTEFGIPTHDATMNVRDAAPIIAGLFFGGPAGIMAGVIGGVERWFSVLWGRGAFTQLACSLGTILAGVYAAILRKYVFNERRPGWPLALATGIVVEVLHLLLVFLTNMQEAVKAYQVVKACSIPMISCNGISAALAAYTLRSADERDRKRRDEVPNISQVVQTSMLAVVFIGFLATVAFTLVLQNSLARSNTKELLSLAMEDVQAQIADASDSNILSLTQHAARVIPSVAEADQETIDQLIKDLDVAEIHVVGSNGIIVASSDQKYVGFDMASGEQSKAFLTLLGDGRSNYVVQEYQPMAYDSSVWRKFAGVRIEGGFIQVGYDASEFMDDLRDHVLNAVENRHVGQDGMLVVLAPDNTLVGTRSDVKMLQHNIEQLVKGSTGKEEGSVFQCSFRGQDWNASYLDVEGYRIYALESYEEAMLARDLAVLVTSFAEVIVFAALFVAIYLSIRHVVVRSIWEVNGTLDKITNGDLDAEVTVSDSAEFASLSRDINKMVSYLRDAIAAEAQRIDRELDYARSIQESTLPRTFPPFPEIKSFDIYANMNPAREVGGDFYDFFLIDEQTLGFLIADVSGKGIPASLFMMAAKAELANYMTSGMSLADAVQTANWHLCQGNDAGMFVTVWAATLNYETGELTYVNAGHNPPLLRHDGKWEWLRKKGGLFLGTFDTARYRSATLTMEPGDEILLYTDGVNEAFSANEEQYGDERLEAFLTRHASMHPHPLIDSLRVDLAHWAEGTDQSDDITMVALEYGVAPQATASLTVPAKLDQLDKALGFIHAELRDRTCPLSAQNQLDIAFEELFVNVCNYAYAESDVQGTITVDYVYNTDPSAITITLTDTGIPFDPLNHDDPNTPTSLDEIKIGGLGILMAKRMTDDLSYVRDGNKNVVAFTKSW